MRINILTAIENPGSEHSLLAFTAFPASKASISDYAQKAGFPFNCHPCNLYEINAQVVSRVDANGLAFVRFGEKFPTKYMIGNPIVVVENEKDGVFVILS